ncbi:MAG: zinc ribbon domain-containing protein [Blastocatellia bacterium]|nr:zinc ribbon domain-containing protein [Blastocatellia bacterium]
MFCPTCGKENALGRKFCVTCGTNLEAVSQALSGSKTDFFTRTDAALDILVAKYAEHVFKDAPANVTDATVGKSWKLLGQGVLTSLMDMILFSLMWNIFPLRFLILLISSPFRLLYERSNRQKITKTGIEEHMSLEPTATATNEMLPKSVASVSEHITERLQEYQQQRQRQVAKTDTSQYH